MSYAEHFVIQNNLRPGDAIMLKKKFFKMFDHFAVYLGRNAYTNRPVFAANYTNGVSIISDEEANYFLQTLSPERIDRFYGNDRQRQLAINRAYEYKDKKNYNLIFNNCEHYKNFVQFGHKYSRQVDNAGNALLIAGGAIAAAGLATKSGKAVGWGLFAFALGAIAKMAADQD
ncbi:hypothetical protein SDC9_59968 [bioreactor metagenome]|uniref:LRAT domain-containing protein n=1 Tax=bioreactor metagenome TaxID=1076179 RepID=A0A644XBM5_9ZZZZ